MKIIIMPNKHANIEQKVFELYLTTSKKICVLEKIIELK